MENKLDYAVKAIIIDENGRMLVLKQVVDGQIFYGLPGGRVNPGASDQEELKREVKEETGLWIKNEKYIGDWSFDRKNGDKTICRTYLIKEYGGELNVSMKESYENILPMWVGIEDFIKKYNNNESLKELINNLQQSKIF